MDSLNPPTALYLAVAVTARGTTGSTGGDSRIKPWKKWLLHSPVGVAWLHLVVYPIWQLALTNWTQGAFDQIHLMIHAVAVSSVGLAGGWIYYSAIQAPLRTDTALKSSTSDAAPQADEPELAKRA